MYALLVMLATLSAVHHAGTAYARSVDAACAHKRVGLHHGRRETKCRGLVQDRRLAQLWMLCKLSSCTLDPEQHCHAYMVRFSDIVYRHSSHVIDLASLHGEQDARA